MPDINLESLTAPELRDLKAKIDATLVSFDKRQKEQALEAVNAVAKAHGFASVNQLLGLKGVTATAGKGTAAAKYANPTDPSQTWSGRGRRPAWFTEALSRGTSQSSMAV